MDTVTYPTPEVIVDVNRHFVCYTVNTAEPGAEGRELLRSYRLLWEPGFVFLDPRGTELRRFIGYRPPEEFRAELALVLGLTEFLYGRPGNAVERFQEAAQLAPHVDLGAEALYWAAIAARRRDGRSLPVLKTGWDELRARYPGSSWAARADVLDYKPTGVRQSR
jgi:hypothetical protein